MNKQELYELNLGGDVGYDDFITGEHPVGYLKSIKGHIFEIVENEREVNSDPNDSYEDDPPSILTLIYKVGGHYYRETGRFSSYDGVEWAGLGKPVEVLPRTRTITVYQEVN